MISKISNMYHVSVYEFVPIQIRSGVSFIQHLNVGLYIFSSFNLIVILYIHFLCSALSQALINFQSFNFSKLAISRY